MVYTAVLQSHVSPSGAALATISAAFTPPPPGRGSTITCCPHAAESFSPTSRAIMSCPVPTTKRTGRTGKLSAASAATAHGRASQTPHAILQTAFSHIMHHLSLEDHEKVSEPFWCPVYRASLSATQSAM